MNPTLDAIRAFAHEREQRCRTPEEEHLLASLPGAGTVYAAHLTAAMGTGRDRWTTGDERLCFSGVAPVMERRGKSTGSSGRAFGPKVLRPSFHAEAGESINHSCWARAASMSPRARGQRHQAAVRALAFQWLRIIDTCGQTRTPYSEVRSLERLRRKGSPLLAVAVHTPS